MTSRFGPVSLDPSQRVEFPKGLVGLPYLKRFALIQDPEREALHWLQSTRDLAWAMALVQPRLLLKSYQVRVSSDMVGPLRTRDPGDVEVYVILNHNIDGLTANLQAPILINRSRRVGIQIPLSQPEYLMRYVVKHRSVLRRSA